MPRRVPDESARRRPVALDGPPFAVVQANNRASGRRQPAGSSQPLAFRFVALRRRGQAMRNMLALFAMVLLTAIGLGWYLGWYKVSSQPAS